MPRIVKRTLLLVSLLAAVGAIALLILLSCATVETTTRGSPTRFRVPLGVGDVAFPLYSATGRQVVLPGLLDGPVVRRDGNGTWSATWFCEDEVGQARVRSDRLRIDCAGQRHSFVLGDPGVAAAVAPMPGRVAVLSDLEGNAAFLDKSLRKLGIVDAAGDWDYGSGHLVVLGDSVDRGRDVFAVLWRLHGLAVQADAAGGAVHVLLGNHEQYLLRTNPTRAHPDHLHALNMMGGYRQAFADDTVIGHWLRRQPVALKLGSVLFVHGGVGPAVVRSGLSVEQLNAAMRAYWTRPATAPPRTAGLDAVLGPAGVTQYRGYFRGLDGRYPAATSADVQLALEHFDASEIVVAHTLVERIQSLHGGRVRAVDVNSSDARPEVLVYEDGVARVVDLGVPRNLHPDEERTFREFSLADAADRALLWDMCRDIRRLSALPYPY
ncbi:metallophosphoesterase [Lysobacter sp. F6437]|uniref:metallophosphoesterase n=1 Tax=Lysobacter sp. F6437 TaxID=3459296 RepID=UPI00403D8BB4